MIAEDDDGSGESDLNRLLRIVSKRGLKALDLTDLDQLRTLLEGKHYADKKAIKSKEKLLKQINNAYYERHERRRLF